MDIFRRLAVAENSGCIVLPACQNKIERKKRMEDGLRNGMELEKV